ncbi:MAG: DsbA family protein [Propionibacteriaceae bacterium]|jgi:protein-disulfide isomerase|nr:DsbA family protein [Propionibacteriaceae bacterium]
MAKRKKRGAQAGNRQVQAQAQRLAAARKVRNRRLLITSVVAVVVAALIGLVVWQATNVTGPTPPSTDPTSPTTSSTGGMFIPPNGSPDGLYIELASPNVKADALVIDEFIDYQCPYCGLLTRMYIGAFDQLVASGDIIMRVHLRSFLDGGIPGQNSVRAATAATCADVVGKFSSYHDVIFANQPEEGIGYSDEQLRIDFPRAAGITGPDLTYFRQCYDSEQTRPYVEYMEPANSTWMADWSAVNAGGKKFGTPTLLVNGKLLPLEELVTVSDDGKHYVPAQDTNPTAFLAFLATIAAS